MKISLDCLVFAMPFAGLAFAPGAALAKGYEVQMVNKGPDGSMTFQPSFIRIEPGDTVTFKPTNPSHNAESIPTMLPTGAQPFKGAMNQPVTVTFTKAGLYGYKCLPHFSMGMVGLVQVAGKADKAGALAATAKLPPLAKARMATYVEKAK